jgi:SAM-dependent methyltransferase
MDRVQSPAVLPHSLLRRLLLTAFGRVARRVAPAQAARAAHGELPERLTLWHRALLAPHIADAERSGNLAALEPLHRWLWSSGQAVDFHASARERFDAWWLAHHSAIVEPLREALGGRIHTLCEVGTGNGLVLADVAQRFPEFERLIGLDLSPAQVQANAQRNRDARVSFVAADAGTWLAEHAQPGWAVFSNAGVFEYFRPPALAELFAALARRAPSAVALVEPIAEGFDPEVAGASVAYGAERSLSHPYLAMLRQAGFRVTWRAEQRVGGVRWLLAVARA